MVRALVLIAALALAGLFGVWTAQPMLPGAADAARTEGAEAPGAGRRTQSSVSDGGPALALVAAVGGGDIEGGREAAPFAAGSEHGPAPAGRELRVRVVDAQTGEPIRGASLINRGVGLVDARTEALDWISNASAGDDGWVRLEVVGDPEARIHVLVTGPGHAPRNVIDLAALSGEDVALERTAALIVRVPGAGDADGLRVELTRGTRRQGEPATEVEEPSSTDGAVRFEALAPGTYSVAATTRAGWIGSKLGVELRPGEERTVSIPREDGVVFRGELLDVETKQPFPGARVELRPESSGVFARTRSRALPEVTTDERGRFEVEGVPLGRTEVRLGLPDGTRVTRTAVVVEHQETRLITFRARGSGTLSGRLSAELLALGEGGGWSLFAAPRGESGAILEAVARGRHGRGDQAAVRTDGSFEFERAPAARRLVLFALAQNGAVGLADVRKPLRVGERRTGIEVPPLERSTLRFEVVDTAGRPVEAIEYRVEERIGDSRAWGRTLAARSSSGRYAALSLTPPPLRVRIGAEGTVERTVRIRGDQTNTVELQRARPIVVMARDPRGFAVSGARVVARPAATEEGAKLPRVRRGWASREGSAELELDPRFDWSVTARADGYGEPTALASVPPGLEAGSVVEVILPPTRAEEPATIRGRLVRNGSGAPLWNVSFARLNGATAALDGPEFEIVGLRPGPVRIDARCGGFETVRLPVKAVQPGETVDVGELRVRAATTLSVPVRDAQGNRVRGARVELFALPTEKGGPGRVPNRLVLSESERDRGTYARAGIVRGKWRLRVSRRGFLTYGRTIQLSKRSQVHRANLKQR